MRNRPGYFPNAIDRLFDWLSDTARQFATFIAIIALVIFLAIAFGAVGDGRGGEDEECAPVGLMDSDC